MGMAKNETSSFGSGFQHLKHLLFPQASDIRRFFCFVFCPPQSPPSSLPRSETLGRVESFPRPILDETDSMTVKLHQQRRRGGRGARTCATSAATQLASCRSIAQSFAATQAIKQAVISCCRQQGSRARRRTGLRKELPSN